MREMQPRWKLAGRCSAIFRKWKTLQTQHYKIRAALKTSVRWDCASGWPTIKVSDFKMCKGRPCHDKPAYEVQRYASNANFPINLLHSMQGIDYVNVIDGASNGFEMLFFFEEALNANRANGSVILERGDSVIMDNCGFHHGHFTEPVLREMLLECRVHVLFQPSYSPHFKTCEFCFRQIKAFLNCHQELAENQTEYSIFLACEQITQQNSINIFRHCGYIL